MINVKMTSANRIQITGIGSLPHASRDAALEHAFRYSLPFLPQIPLRNPKEYMLSQMLSDLPGVELSSDGSVFCKDVSEAEINTFKNRLDHCLNTPHSTEFEPSPDACSLWKPFLFEVENRKLKQAKVQAIGPLTANWAAQGQAETCKLISKLIFARTLSMVRRLNTIGVQAVFFIDEPGLYVFDSTKPEHQASFTELKFLVQALHQAGAQVGIHCCSNTQWGLLLEIQGLKWLSFDVALSLDLILKESERLLKFTDAGGCLAVGVIPTGSAQLSLSQWNVKEGIQKTQDHLSTVLPQSVFLNPNQIMLTAACGLAFSSIHDSEVSLDQLIQAQKFWRETQS